MESEENSFSKSQFPIPPPPGLRRRLSLASLFLVGGLALSLALVLYPAARFALQGDGRNELGSLATADLTVGGSWVQGRGTPKQEALSFRRRGRTGSFRLTQLEERNDLWLVLPVPRGAKSHSEPNARITRETYVPPSLYRGRLVPLGEAGLMLDPIAKLVRAQGAGPQSFILLEGDSPSGYRHLLIAALLLAFIGCGCLSFATFLMAKSR